MVLAASDMVEGSNPGVSEHLPQPAAGCSSFRAGSSPHAGASNVYDEGSAIAATTAGRGNAGSISGDSGGDDGGGDAGTAAAADGVGGSGRQPNSERELSEWQLFALQTSAVLRKNTTLQKRAWGQNLCLLGLPLLFCVLLLVLQRLVNTQLGSSESYRCGCKCLECCDWVASGPEGSETDWECYRATSERPCSPYAHCKARDRSQCGAQYSTYAQIAFCDVRYPSTWPAVLQVPPDEYRPMGPSSQTRNPEVQPSSPPSSLLPRPIVAPYTGRDLATSHNLSQHVVPREGDRGIGARILRDLREVQQRLRSGTSSGGANSTSSSTNGGSSNPMMAILSGTLGRGRGGGEGGADDGNDRTTYIDLCDPSVDVAVLFRSNGSVAPSAVTHGSVNRSTSPASVAASLSPEQLAGAASALTQILSDYDLLLGTATDAPYTNLLEPALIVGSRILGASRGAGTSSVVHGSSGGGGHLLSGGGGGGVELDFTTDPDQVLPLYYLSRNCSALTATDRRVMSQLSCALSRGMGLPELQCATWAPSWGPDAAAIERELFCGWSGTQCAASAAAAADTAASPVGGDGRPKATADVTAAAPPPPPSTYASSGRRMLQQQQQTVASAIGSEGPANSTTVDAMTSRASPTKGVGIPPSAGPAGVVARTGTNTAAAAPQSRGPAMVGATAGGADVMDSDERIVQYPSAVYDWRTSGPMGLDLTIWVNNSDIAASVAPRVQRWPAAINAATNAWLAATAASRGIPGQNRTHWVLRLAGIKGFPTRGSPLRLDLASLMGPLFFMWVMQLLLPTYVHTLVTERESGAELLMRQQGLRAAPAALAAYCWFAALYAVFMLIFVGFGAAIGLNIFTKTSPGVQAAFYLVWGNAMVSWAFWFAAAWSSAGAATLAATTTVVLTGLVSNMIVAQFVTSGPHWLATLLEAFPPFALFRGLWEMSQYAFLAAANGNPQGLTWSRLYDDGNGTTIAWALLAAVTVWCVMWTWYWGKVFGPDEQGVHSHPFFFLGFRLEPDDPRGWDWFAPSAARQRWARSVARWRSKQGGDRVRRRGRDAAGAAAMAVAAADAAAVYAGNDNAAAAAAVAAAAPGGTASEESAVAAPMAAAEADATTAEDLESEDVQEERRRVEVLWRQLTAASGTTTGGRAAAATATAASSGGNVFGSHTTPPPALLLRNVRKVFPGKGSVNTPPASAPTVTAGGARGSPSPQVAVRNLSLAVGSRETLGLLGPNGAGKTTTLRIMQGILEPSSGSVLVCGLDLSTQSARVAQLVGICPQHDVLWPSLTGREHVRLFGRIKGLRGPDLDAAVAAVLEEAGLREVADRAAGGYSGGMQRRLSVVCALVGSPRVLYLDEPSTGLDPASRRLLWKAVLHAKRRCAVILTTHSMEEAEALCDRLGVVVGGALRCIGTPQQLMARYSSYLMLSLTAAPCCSDEEVEAFVCSHVSASAKQVYCLNGFHSYEVPRRDVDLAELFRTMAAVQVDDDDDIENNHGAGVGEYASTVSAAWTAAAAAAAPGAAVPAAAPGRTDSDTQGHTLSSHVHMPRFTMGSGSGAPGGLTQCPPVQRAAAPGAQVALLDWAVSSATLESVFVRVCREAGAVVEAAVGRVGSGGV